METQKLDNTDVVDGHQPVLDSTLLHSARDQFHVVGIGASAGGLEALEQFFENTPADSPLCFGVVQHLSPDFKSMMDELLARRTLEAAERLGRDGVSAEVIDLRPIAPMDIGTVLESVAGTGRIAIVQEGPIAGGWGSTLLSQLVLAGADLRCRPVMVASPDSPGLRQ